MRSVAANLDVGAIGDDANLCATSPTAHAGLDQILGVPVGMCQINTVDTEQLAASCVVKHMARERPVDGGGHVDMATMDEGDAVVRDLCVGT